jgi:hypothetical protein
MSKLNMRNGAIFEKSPSGAWLIKSEYLRKWSSRKNLSRRKKLNTQITFAKFFNKPYLISNIRKDTGN